MSLLKNKEDINTVKFNEYCNKLDNPFNNQTNVYSKKAFHK